MEPRIQYAKTSDGVNIAFWTLGEGMPVVEMPAGEFSHIQLEWQTSHMRGWYEGLAKKRMLVHYDGRGRGLSDRDATDYSLEAEMLDLKAVVDRLGLDRFALIGLFGHGPVAINYAVQHPEQVSHLILWMAVSRGSDESPKLRAMNELRDADWNLYTRALAGLFGGQPEEVTAAATYLRECVTPEVAKAIDDASREFDVAHLLPKVTSPTLVFHRRQYQFLDLNVSRSIVAQIPDARLVLLDGDSAFAYIGDMDAALDAVDEFLGEGEQASGAETPTAGAFRTILFTDIEGSTAMTQRLGDAKAREVLREHERITRECLRAHGGAEVKTMGDGFMASFGSAVKALECAVAIQQAFAEHNESAPERILVRVGLNAGEPIAEEQDLFGTAVIRAARIAALAQGGEILAANVVRELAEGKGFLFGDRGEVALRGFDDPVRVFEVRWREEE